MHPLANWSRRKDIVDYCVGVVDQSLDEQRQLLQDAGDDASARRKAQGILYAEEVKVSRFVIYTQSLLTRPSEINYTTN